MQPYWGPVLRCCIWRWPWGRVLCLFPFGVGYNQPFTAPVWVIAPDLPLIYHYVSVWELINYFHWPVCLNATCNWPGPPGEKDNGPRWKIQSHSSSAVSFFPNDMFYILINNRFYFFVPSQPQRQLFQINMWPPAFRAGSEWVEGKMRENRQQTE